MHLFLSIFLALSTFIMAQQALLEDEILVVIYYPKGRAVITRSDIKPGLDGSPRTLRDIVLEMLMVIDKIMLHGEDEGDIERYLVQLQKQHGLSRVALEALFTQLGYTYEEGREELRRKNMIDAAIDFRVRQDKHMLVSEQEVKDFCEKNPVYSPMTFVLQQAYVSYDDMPADQLAQALKDPVLLDKITWEEPFEISEQDLAEDKQFIKTAPIGSIVEQEPDDEGVEITRLIERQEPQQRSFDERRDAVELDLRKERYYTLLHDYQNKLLREAHMSFAHQSDKDAVTI